MKSRTARAPPPCRAKAAVAALSGRPSTVAEQDNEGHVVSAVPPQLDHRVRLGEGRSRRGAPSSARASGSHSGAGAAFTLDEFALWLYLRDVYWCPEGRSSIDATVMGVLLAALLLVGTSPFGIGAAAARRGRSRSE